MLRTGERLGEFRIRRLLGSGGMGEVYEAFEPALGRLVALKLLPPWLAEQPKALERFQNEAATAARLEHPNIVPIYSWGQSDDRFFFTMKLVRGLPLSRFIERRLLHERNALATTQGAAEETPRDTPPDTPHPDDSGTAEGDETQATVAEQVGSNAECGVRNAESDSDAPDDAATRVLEPPAGVRATNDSNFLAELHHVYEEYRHNLYDFSARMGADLADALAYAHGLGQIHRDLKPSNVMIDCHGHVYLIDFGLTTAITLDATRHRRGTLRYMSPEQLDLDALDGRTDIYSLGVTLYETISPQQPFDLTDESEITRRIRAGAVLPLELGSPRIPHGLARVIRRAMNPRAEQRYQAAAEMAADLRACLTSAEPPHALESKDAEAKVAEAHALKAQVGGADAPDAQGLEPAVEEPASQPSDGSGAERRSRRVGRIAAALGVVFVLLMAALFWWAPIARTLGLSSAARLDRFDGGIENSIGMKFVQIRPGRFQMGADQSEKGMVPLMEMPKHWVEITRPFWMGMHEVTQSQYQKVMGYNPSFFQEAQLGVADAGDYPVETVTWEDAQLFCEKLSQLKEEREAGRRYRLPTEAEWEYACRAGTTTRFHFGDDISAKQANVGGLEAEAGAVPRNTTSPVGSFASPNAFGLHDMHGNVTEWCQDCYAEYLPGLQYDPLAPIPANKGPDANRVARGGCFGALQADCRSARRNSFPPTDVPPETMKSLGFRVVCDYVPESK